MAAEVGHLRLAYDYLGEAALMDLRDLENNTRDGLHIASLAGTWIALVAGFGGMRHCDGTLDFAPRCRNGSPGSPSPSRCWGGGCGSRSPTPRPRTRLMEGAPMELRHYGRAASPWSAKEPRTRRWSRPPRGAEPRQPPGREPVSRH